MTATAQRENRWATAGGNTPPAPGNGRAGATATAGATARPSRFRSRKFRILAVVAVLVIGGGAFLFLKPEPKYVPSGGDIVALDPTTVNLSGGHYLKVSLAVELLKGKATADDFHTSHAAELLIDEFANRSVGSLSSNEARKKLTDDLLGKLKKAYPDKVYDIYLTQFVTQ